MHKNIAGAGEAFGTVAALSVDIASVGNATGSLRFAASVVNRSRNSRFAATPPVTSTLAAPTASAAAIVRRTRFSTTAC